MKTRSLFALLFALVVGSSAWVAAPAQRPAPPVESILYYFDRLPARHFAPFGPGVRRTLLKRSGVIYDPKARFIEIPMAGDPNGQAIWKMQISVFRNAGVDVVAVSRLVWQQTREPSELTFYQELRRDGKMALVDQTRTLLPGQRSSFWDSEDKKTVFLNAHLPRRGNTITFEIPETDAVGDVVTWTRGRFVTRK